MRPPLVVELVVLDVSELIVLLPEEPVVLPVPLAPMLDVPLPVVPLPLAVVPELPLVVSVELEPEELGEVLELVLLEELGLLLVVSDEVLPELEGLVVLFVVALGVEPEVPELVELPEDVWAIAIPPKARAAAAARVVRVFLLLVMSLLLDGNPEGK